MIKNRNFNRINDLNVGDIWDTPKSTIEKPTRNQLIIVYKNENIVICAIPEQTGFVVAPATEEILDIAQFQKFIIKNELEKK